VFTLSRSAVALSCFFALAPVLVPVLAPGPALAQERPNMGIVLDASGSMWGQVDGQTKMDLARAALTQVLGEATPDMDIGMIAYGHRARGQCTDIEVLVPSGPAVSSVPAILGAAGRISPLGMTPLSDAVMQAAGELRFAEQAATVVLLTDGVESCGGDPCALGRMLEQQGIDFTAHVIGFDMSDAEQQSVACLATETGGLFLAASDADDLARALRETILTPPAPPPEVGPVARQVTITLRDSAGGPSINGREVALTIEPEGGQGTLPTAFQVVMDQPVTAVGQFLPGRYTAVIRRDTGVTVPVSLSVPIVVPEGTGPHDVEIILGARLRLTALAHAGLPMPEGGGNLPFAAYGSSSGRAFFAIHPVIDGTIDTSVDYGGINSLDISVPPGDYLVRGGLSRSFSRERLVRVRPGEITELVFDFEAARVFVDMRTAQGIPVDRLSSYFYESGGSDYFLNGGGRDDSGLLPFYLPVGTWRVDAGTTGSGQARAQAVFTVNRPGEDVTVSLQEGQRVDAAGLARLRAENPGCITHIGYEYGCLVEAVSPRDFLRLDGIDPASPEGRAALAPRFGGTWLSESGPLSLVQDGRRVWGDVPGGVLVGEVAADGLTLRGLWAEDTVELRLSRDGLSMAGSAGSGLDPTLGGPGITARKVSAGRPSLALATGTGQDLPAAYRGGASPEFEAFMAPARGAASGDIDQMQATAPPASFAGVWTTNHQSLTLHQQGRRVWGERARGVIEGEVSADGRTLRGTWTTGSDWGTFEFALDQARRAFTGQWGRGADPDLQGGGWTGSRVSYLPGTLTRGDATAMARPTGAAGAVFEGFMAPVRDAGLPDPVTPVIPVLDPAPSPRTPATAVELNPGFTPSIRRDFANEAGQTVISIAFGPIMRGGDVGTYADGYAWLAQGWCGAGCPEEILPVGGRTSDSVPNGYERLDRGGVFPASSVAHGRLVFEVLADALMVHGLDDDYTEGAQLGVNRELIARTFGTYRAVEATPAGLTGWPPLPFGAGGVTVEPVLPVVDGEPAPDLRIGTIDILPIGVFAEHYGEPGDSVAMLIDAVLTDDDLRKGMAQQCTREPVVLYPDGLIAVRELDGAAASAGSTAYTTTMHERCEQAGPILACTMFFDAPEDPFQNGDSYTLQLATGPEGTFTMSLDDDITVYRPCFGPDGLTASDAQASDGRPLWQHIVERGDNGPGLTLTAAGQYEAAASSLVGGGPGDLSAAVGIWAEQVPGSDPDAMALQCFQEPLVMRPDGRFRAFVLDDAGLPVARPDELDCSAGSQCTFVVSGAAAPANMPARLSLSQPGPDRLRLCDDATTCSDLQRCDPMTWSAREQASGLADRWIERVMAPN